MNGRKSLIKVLDELPSYFLYSYIITFFGQVIINSRLLYAIKNLVILGVARNIVVQAGNYGKLFTLLFGPLS